MTLFANKPVRRIDLYFLTEDRVVLVGVRVFDCKGTKIAKLGSVRAVQGKPVTERVFLNEDERIVGIHFKKANYKGWLQMQADFAFIVARKSS